MLLAFPRPPHGMMDACDLSCKMLNCQLWAAINSQGIQASFIEAPFYKGRDILNRKELP